MERQLADKLVNCSELTECEATRAIREVVARIYCQWVSDKKSCLYCDKLFNSAECSNCPMLTFRKLFQVLRGEL